MSGVIVELCFSFFKVVLPFSLHFFWGIEHINVMAFLISSAFFVALVSFWGLGLFHATFFWGLQNKSTPTMSWYMNITVICLICLFLFSCVSSKQGTDSSSVLRKNAFEQDQ